MLPGIIILLSKSPGASGLENEEEKTVEPKEIGRTTNIADKKTKETLLNIGSGMEVGIGDLAKTIANVVGYEGVIEFDDSKPDGMPRKLLECSRIRKMGWTPKVDVNDGLQKTYAWALENQILT